MTKVSKIMLQSFAAAYLLLGHLAGAQINLTIDANAGRHPIDPNIYGIAGYGGLDADFAKEIALPVFRWGGDATTRYNWLVDSSNSGADWYFMGGSGVSNPTPSGQVDAMIESFEPAGTRALITIPIIPYINSTSETTCSYRESVYGAQQSYNPYATVDNGDQCGNGVDLNGNNIIDTDIYYNHIDNNPQIQKEWIQHLVWKFHTGEKDPIHYFQLDNEPYGWSNTHRDVMPNGADYATITTLGIRYATAIKQVDPDAKVFGPSDFTLDGWLGDQSTQNGLWAGQYYLQQFAAHDANIHSRTLDYFDEHYYGQAWSAPGGEMQSTRALWDPTYNSGTWLETYYTNGPLQLIPRFKSWIDQYYPGTKLSISEYSMTSSTTAITDGITEADTLGIFGREGVSLASLWGFGSSTDPVAYSFRIYRNYDGNGGKFGDVSISSTSDDQTQLAVYGAERKADHAITLVIINKTWGPISSSVTLNNVETHAQNATAFQYSGDNIGAIVALPAIPLQKNHEKAVSFTAEFPPTSATVVVIPRGDGN